MSGVKGRSGRRVMRDEEKRYRIIEKAWDLIELKLNEAGNHKYDVARDIVNRDITTHQVTKVDADVTTTKDRAILHKYIQISSFRPILSNTKQPNTPPGPTGGYTEESKPSETL